MDYVLQKHDTKRWEISNSLQFILDFSISVCIYSIVFWMSLFGDTLRRHISWPIPEEE